MSAPLLQALERGFGELPAAALESAGLGAARRAQLAAALADGLPGARAERWRYTSLRALERRQFGLASATAQVDAAALPDMPGARLVFVNGVFDARLSRLDGLPAGVELLPLSRALDSCADGGLDFLAERFDAADDTFARLNAAFALDGLLLRVQPGVQCDIPVALLMVGAAAADSAVHLRHRVELGEGARLALVEYQLAAGAQAHLVNTLVQIAVGPRAQLSHLRVQCEDAAATLFARTEAVLAEGADYQRVDLELGAALTRHELNVRLAGDGASLRSRGVLLADGRRHVDTRLGIEHSARDTRCELTWRGLGAERGRAVFHGGILIQAGADGTSAQLSNKNLLLSANAEVDTQPVLEIHADEVQAAHGATVGQLHEQALFYLRSRGVPEAQARTLLTLAFCRVALDELEDAALREQLDALLSTRLLQVAA